MKTKIAISLLGIIHRRSFAFPRVLRFVFTIGLLFVLSVNSGHALDFADSPSTYPHGLTSDGTHLWHADYDAGKIYKLDDSYEELSSFNFAYGSPRGVAYGDGVLFVATGAWIYRMDPSTGAYISHFATPDATDPNQQGLAYGDGKLWIASRGVDDRIYGVNPTTGASMVDFAAPGTNPRGLTYYDGAVWNLDSTDDKLYQLSPTTGAIQGTYPIPLGDPRGLAAHKGRFVQADYTVDLIMDFVITNTFANVYCAPLQYPCPETALHIPYMASHSLTETNATIRRILVYEHGIDDNAVNHFAHARYAAKQAGDLEETLISSLQFLDDDKLSSAPPSDMIYWTSSRFWGAKSAHSGSIYPRSERKSSFSVLDDFLTGLTTNAAQFPALEEIVVAGHSGGGQFANRYAATSPFEDTMMPQDRDITVSYVVMNPSSYVYFDDKRYDPATIDLGAGTVDFISPSPAVAGHNNYGYGLDALYGYHSGVGVDANDIIAQYPSRKVIYLIGESDTTTDSLDVSNAAMLEGTNRYHRCLIYYEHLKQFFGIGNLPRHRLISIPNVGHSSYEMINSGNGINYVFQGRSAMSGFTASPTAVTIQWEGGDGFADIYMSSNLVDWTPIASNIVSPYVITNNAAYNNSTHGYYRLTESRGP